MAQSYPPLRILEILTSADRGFNTVYNFFHNMPEVQNMDTNQILWYFLRDKFLQHLDYTEYNAESVNLFERMDQQVALNCKRIMNYLGYSEDAMNDSTMNIRAELRDCFVIPIVWQEWSNYKQVYKPDMYFADALLNTENFQLSKSMLKHLPCKTFYIDVSDCPQFGNICGIFVYVFLKGNRCEFVLNLIAKNLVEYSCYVHGSFDERGILNLDAKFVDPDILPGYKVTSLTSLQDIAGNHLPDELFLLNREESYHFAMQMISYLSIDKPQITESSLTKDTYRPASNTTVIRNKWSEVKIDDIGIKYGKTIRTKLEEVKNNSDTSGINVIEFDVDESEKTRKSPAPHFRSAHWHRYWVGEGRKECRVNWIEPTFVGADFGKDVVIHKVE